MECIIQMLKTMTRQLLANLDMPFTDWDKVAGDCIFAYNTAMQESMGENPFYLIHGFHPNGKNVGLPGISVVTPEVATPAIPSSDFAWAWQWVLQSLK